MTKIYECEICKRLTKNKVKGHSRVKGTRKDIRKHLREIHGVKGKKNKMGATKKEFGISALTLKTLSEEIK
jgi:hypothetical protein